ncbi:hypothetical protein [Marinobacter salicampi]|uniref:hypothetical protein n=1 Tax=Marinobacter salicampi TaxID=435907 RepID=UPI0014077FB6|nr:hypothetical protein [Marinobacter salicampi]
MALSGRTYCSELLDFDWLTEQVVTLFALSCLLVRFLIPTTRNSRMTARLGLWRADACAQTIGDQAAAVGIDDQMVPEVAKEGAAARRRKAEEVTMLKRMTR